MRRSAVAMLCLAFATPAFSANPVGLTEVTHAYDTSLPHFDKTFQLALLETRWLPLAVTAGEITAETRDRWHYAKVRIRFGDGKATFTLLDSNRLDQGVCNYRKDGKAFRGECIHPAYYDWVESTMKALPLAHAKIAVVKSLASPAAASGK